MTSDRKRILIFYICCFLLLFLLNSFSPYVYDDLSYRYIWGTTERVRTVSDVIRSQADHYVTWGGRSVAHTIGQVFLISDSKLLFNIMNSIIYLVHLCLLVKIGIRHRETAFSDHLYAFILTWFGYAKWGEISLWLIGSCNYLWTTTFILLFMYLILNDVSNNSIPNALLFIISGFIAGWTNENSAPALLVFCIGYLIIQGKKPTIQSVAGIAALIVGMIILIIAPGNFVRMKSFDNTNILVLLITRTLTCTAKLLYTNIPLILIMIFLGISGRKKIKTGWKKSLWPLFLLSGLTGNYAMVLSPYYPPRSATIVNLFFMLAIISFAEDLDIHVPVIRKAGLILMILSLTYVIPNNIRLYYEIEKKFPQQLAELKQQGIQDAVLDSPGQPFDNHAVIDPISHYLSTNSDSWFNTVIAEEYGFRTIRQDKGYL